MLVIYLINKYISLSDICLTTMLPVAGNIVGALFGQLGHPQVTQNMCEEIIGAKHCEKGMGSQLYINL